MEYAQVIVVKFLSIATSIFKHHCILFIKSSAWTVPVPLLLDLVHTRSERSVIVTALVTGLIARAWTTWHEYLLLLLCCSC